MTISDITVGSASTANNAPVIPGTPSGLLAGDLVLIFAAIRNNGVGSPNTPAGWERVASLENLAVFGRFWQTGDTMPSVTFTGGVANADTYARAIKARGVAKDMLQNAAAVTTSNASAGSINYNGITPAGSGHLLTMFAWKQDDATSYTTPSGFTAQGLTNQTTGDDMSSALFTQLQTTTTTVAGGAITVVGGVSAISRVILLAFAPAPAVVVTEVPLFPPAARITVTGLTTGDDLIVYRVVGGTRTEVRGGSASSVTDPSFVVVDAELPFDVPVSYEVVVNSFAIYTTASTTYALPGGKAVLTDAITGESASVIVISWPEKVYNPQSSIFKAGGRNVVVTGDIGMFEGTIEIFFESFSSSENFFNLLATATEGVLQLRAPASQYDGVDCYLAVTGARERRFSQDGSDGRRTWVLEVAEVEEWSEGLTAKAFTYADITSYYASAGGSYANLKADYATYLAVRTADWI